MVRKLALLCAMTLIALMPPVFGRPVTLRQKLAAMELTLFNKTFCKDTPIRRVERLEENFLDAQTQKDKELPTRLNDLMDRVKPAPDLLEQPDPCEEKPSNKDSTGFVGRLMGQHPDKNDCIESEDYPLKKWKALKIPELGDAVAQLTTDFEASAGALGKLKYKLLLKMPNENLVPRTFLVTFYDRNEFKLTSFAVNGQYFRETSDANLWEANESQPFSEKNYKQARFYRVNLP